MISRVLPPSLQAPRGLLSYLHRVLNELKAVGLLHAFGQMGDPARRRS
jgi:hypothetical protein